MLLSGRAHVQALLTALPLVDTELVDAWGARLAAVLVGGGRLLVAGNGGSAAQAQHLTAELVGRYRDDRPALSAIALHAETSAVTAIANDYGWDHVFARQVQAHGRPGDVFLGMSTSGRSGNVLAAMQAARDGGLLVWAMTGTGPNPMLEAADEALSVAAPATATVQEVHQVALHLLCAALDLQVGADRPSAAVTVPLSAGSDVPHPPVVSVRADKARDSSALSAGSDVPNPPVVSVRADRARDSSALSAGSDVPNPPVVSVRADRARGRAVAGPLVVVGDTLLDRDLVGSVDRLCPDAPVPVVDEPVEHSRPGGAGLAALLAAADGRDVTLITALAPDAGGAELRALLADAGVRVVDLGLAGATPEKVRVRAQGRSLLRLDRGGAPGTPGDLTPEGAEALAGAGAVLVADYGRGLTRGVRLRAALTAMTAGPAGPGDPGREGVALAGALRPGSRRTPVVWDPHPRGAEPVAGCTLVTPNGNEAGHFAPGHGGAQLTVTTARARELQRRWAATAVAVTMGSRGALVVEGDAPPSVVPAPDVPCPDPCGAGDRFASAAAGLLADGALPSEAVAGAVLSASAFVAAGGAAQVRVGSPTPAGPPDAGAADIVARVRAGGGTVVATGGCFDLLHAGHVAVLQQARALGDCLVVLLNSDDSVRRLKGPSRPLQGEDDRADVLRALGCVDAVLIFDEDTPARALDALRPDVFAKGGDYALTSIPEADVVAGWGGQAVVLPYLAGRSTTNLIREAATRG